MPRFSWLILLLLLAMLAAALAVFAELVRRWTSDRPQSALKLWAKLNEFRFRQSSPRRVLALPEALASLGGLSPQVLLMLQSRRHPLRLLVHLQTQSKLSARWHLLIVQLPVGLSPAGLRPASLPASWIDLFQLQGYPAMLPPDRFIVFAVDVPAARRIADTPIRGLLPPDIGLLLHGPWMTLDFSSRPFDEVEFERMAAIAEQVQKSLQTAV